jgi:hypothetical protein
MEYNGMIHHSYTGPEKAHGSVMRELLYNILNQFGISMKLVRLLKMCLNETYSKILMGKILFGAFSIQNSVK